MGYSVGQDKTRTRQDKTRTVIFLAFLAFLASLISDVTLTALTFITGKCRNREGTFFGSRQNGKVSVPISRLSALP